MSILRAETRIALIQTVEVTDDEIRVGLADGRVISAPLTWYPRLLHGSTEERGHQRLIGGGEGIHWPDLDEDVSAENLVFGQPSAESQTSLQSWLARRRSQ